MDEKRFYVYAYLREDGTPYYIGKGCKNRAYDYHRHNIKPPKDKNRIIFLKKGLTDQEAYDYEKEMISFYGRKDLGTGILRNLSDGGHGPLNPSPESRKKNSERNKKAYAEGKHPLSKLTKFERVIYGHLATEARKKSEWFKENPEYWGGSLGRTPEKHKKDSKKAWQKGLSKWMEDTKDDPIWQKYRKELSRKNGLKNAKLGIGICGLSSEERSNIIKNFLADPVKGPKQRKLLSEKGKKQYAQGIGIASEEAKQKSREVNLERTGHDFTVRSPDGKIHTGHGIKPFARKHGIPMESFRALVQGKTPKVCGWTLPDYDEYKVLNLFREGLSKEEIKEIVGYGVTYVDSHFPKPEEGYKWCIYCFEQKLFCEFTKDETRKDGYREKCSQCNHTPEEWSRKQLLKKGYKKCTICGEELLINSTNFHKDGKYPSGEVKYKGACKKCIRPIARKAAREAYKKKLN